MNLQPVAFARSAFLRGLVLLLIAALLCESAFADAPMLRLRLKDGSYIDGQFRPATDKTIGFESSLFTKPIEFDIRALRSAAGDLASEEAKSGHAFLLDGGTRITGELKSWNDTAVVVQTKSLGEITIQRSMLRAVESVADIGKRVYSGPRSIDDWELLDSTDKWEFVAGSLTSPDNEAKAAGKVNLPTKFRLSLSMSWEGRADFVLSLGCRKPKKPEPPAPGQNRVRRAMVQSAQDDAAVRLEMWDAQLAVVREVGNLADIAVLPLDDGISKFDLVFYVDQVAGLVAVYSPRGRLLEKIQVAEEKGVSNTYALLENHGKSVSLDSFDVYEWDGHLPDSTEFPDGYILGKDNKVASAEVVGFDAKEKSLSLVDADGKESSLPLTEVRRIVLVQSKADEGQKGEGKASEGKKPVDTAGFPAIPLDESRMIEVDFADTSRLVGYLSKPQAGKFAFRGDGIGDTFTCSVADIVAISGASDVFEPKKLNAPYRILSTQSTRLKGALVDNVKPKDGVLMWHPWGATNAVSISKDHSGSINTPGGVNRFKEVPPTSITPKVPRPGFGNIVGGIFGGGKLRVDRPNGANGNLKALPKFEIVFRSGDTVDGVVQAVDERGVTLASEETTTTFVPHDQMDSITLARSISKPDFNSEDLKRLLTVPRSQKSDPPTHLFVSTTGDYLRGRLVGINKEKVGVEVRMDVQEVPRENVARVIWLHDRPWLDDKPEEGEKKADEKDPDVKNAPFLVHAVRPDKRGVTFSPKRLEGRVLSGDSDLLGECKVKVDSLRSLLFGRDVGVKALALRKESWTLELATLPKAYLDDGSGESGGPPMGTSSPLVGKDAPEIKLQTIDDVEFVLTENRDKVIVLDFWASWCGPCIATMPKLEAVIAEHDPRKVELVAVNLQDSVERARIALERMKIEPTVVMDVDGETARFYDAKAIPQTVIVNKSGKITHLFVGGGSKFLEQFSAALTEVLAAE